MTKSLHEPRRSTGRVPVAILIMLVLLFCISILHPLTATFLLNARTAHAMRFWLIGGTVRVEHSWEECYGRDSPNLDPNGWFWLSPKNRSRNPFNSENLIPQNLIPHAQIPTLIAGGLSNGTSYYWREYSLPLWLPTLLLVTPWIISRFKNPRLPGACPRCGYSLHGLPTKTCPECGSIADPGQ